MKAVVTLVCLLLILPSLHAAGEFDLTKAGKDGTGLISTTCNIQTTLEFQFSSSTTLSSAGVLTNPSASTFNFLTAAGDDVKLSLQDATFDKSSTATGFVTGYGTRVTNSSLAFSVTPTAAFIFQFGDTAGNIVYVYIPVINSNTAFKNSDVIDLTSSAISNSLNSFTSSLALSAFNIFDQNILNLWYTAVNGKTTILVSNFIFNVNSIAGAVSGPSGLASTVAGQPWNSNMGSSGDKLCYASTIANMSFQTHLRESVPLWFIWFWVFIYWLFYLCSDSTNVKVYDNHYEDNRWTCVAVYSLANLAHEECFTRLSRLSVIMINWTIQGVIIACIYGNQFLSAPMIIWTAVVAFVATLPVPFLLGYVIFRKIYDKNLMKYDNMKAMKGVFDKAKLEPLEHSIDTCEEKLYGYYHWFYSFVVITIFICWPIAINQMQKLPRTLYHYHWYWLASMGIVFVLEYIIYEPLLALIFGNTSPVRARGGYFYNFRLGQAYRAAQTY